MDEVPEILLCEVSNEVEAAMVVNLLNEDGIPARSDANQAMNVFGGLPFEPGHSIFVASSLAQKGPRDPGRLSPFQEPQKRPRTRVLKRRDPGRFVPHDGGQPVRVCYVVSFFHPFASGAERQALAQGSELVRRGHVVHVVTRSVPGYPIVDEEYQGIFIHRWIKTASSGPLFGLSFVAGVVAGAAEAPRRDRRDPHPPGPLGSRGGRSGSPLPEEQADLGAAGQRGLLRRGG